MKTLLLLLWLLPALCQAQGVVNVNIRSLVPQRLVLDSNGTPLVGTNYVAQIVYGANAQSLTNELGAVMPFRVTTTTAPGTWNHGLQSSRVLNGITEGATAWIRVRVWDQSVYTTWQEAFSAAEAGYCRVHQFGMSEAFQVILGSPDLPTSGQMTLFQGFQLTSSSRPVCNAGDKLFEVGENGPPMFIRELDTYFYSSNGSLHLSYYDQRIGTLTSTNGGWWFVGRPNSFGLFQQVYRAGVVYTPPSAQEYYGVLTFRVTPSPRRPFLDFALTNSQPSLTLRGLPPRSYRIEGSTNLAGWTRLGELSMGEDGNAPVPEAWLATNATQFVRFVPLPP